MVYKTKGTCSVEIYFDVNDGRLHNVKFTGGCNGNLKGIGALVEGMKPEDVIARLEGTTCGFRHSSSIWLQHSNRRINNHYEENYIDRRRYSRSCHTKHGTYAGAEEARI